MGARCAVSTAWRTTIGTNPCWMASTAVARTHPLVDTPAITRVSTRDAVSAEASGLPKNALAYCLTITSSAAPVRPRA